MVKPDKDVSTGRGDFQRSLTLAGQKEVSDIAKSLKELGTKFDVVITSPLKRAHQTAAIVAKTLKMKKKCRIGMNCHLKVIG